MSLAAAILNLCPIEARLPDPIGILVSEAAGEAVSFDKAHFDSLSTSFIAAGLRAPIMQTDARDLSRFDKIANDALLAVKIEPIDLSDPVTAIHWARQRSLASARYRHQIDAADGAQLSVIHAGQNVGKNAGKNNGHHTLFFGAPGTPAELHNGWLKGFADQGEVTHWEMRGLFGDNFHNVQDLSVKAQLSDIDTVMEFVGWEQAHVMGICGGAVLALAYAAACPARVQSLSLWFGDYELGDLAPKTAHQKNLKSLMKMVADGQVKPQALQSILLSAMTGIAQPEIAPMVLYPFASPSLLAQYCRMNYAIMATDCGPLAGEITMPSFVAYSPHDETTHPEGSRVIAARLGANLEQVDVSGHMDVLHGRRQDIDKVIEFQKSSLKATGTAKL